MRKLLFLLLSLGVIFTSCKKKDPTEAFLASETPQTKTAVLEDFTGVRCGYCPDGHAVALNISNTLGDKFIVIATHSGQYAAPASGWADFTTPFGDALIAQSALTGYPAGTMNRHLFTGGQYNVQNNGLAMGRGGWSAAANSIILENAPVNIGAKATFDASSRVLTVKVDLFYTASETAANNINIGFIQDGLTSKQSGGTPDPNNYVQNNVLRTYITGQWGDPVPAESQASGSKYSKTYTYTVPADFNGATVPPGGGAVVMANCRIVIFVNRDHTEILNGIKVPIQ